MPSGAQRRVPKLNFFLEKMSVLIQIDPWKPKRQTLELLENPKIRELILKFTFKQPKISIIL